MQVIGAFDRRVLRVGPAGHPHPVAAHQVRAEDDTGPVVFEALGGVDAADLAEAAGVGGPVVRLGDVRYPFALGLRVPRSLPGADADVVDETSFAFFADRITPPPAIALP